MLLGAAALLLATACTSSPSRGKTQNTYSGEEGTSEIEATAANAQLHRDLEIQRIRSERRDGRLHVQFDLRNKRQGSQAIEWSIEWKDAAGFTIDDRSHWQPLVIGGGGYETISITATSPDAAAWRLQVRPSSPVR